MYEGGGILACIDPSIVYNELSGNDWYSTILKVNPDKYINSGVMIFNIQQCIKFKLFNNFINTQKQLPFKVQDENIFNIILYKNQNLLSMLEPKWNCFNNAYFYHDGNMDNNGLKKFINSINNIGILHYTGVKPWNNKLEKGCEIWWMYARKTPVYEEIKQNYLAKNLKKKYPKPLINFFCCFIPNKQKRKAFRNKLIK